MARVLAVLNLVQSRGRWNAKGIADELGCSERTIYRDLEVLEFAGVPWYFDEQDQCYRVRSDYKFPVLGLTEDELLGQALATSATDAPGLNVGLGAAATTRKLAAASAEHDKQLLMDAVALISVLDLKMADHSRHHDAIRTIQFALLKQRQLIGTYESPYEPGQAKLKIHPYRLVLIKNAWYVIGKHSGEPHPRTYRVARFKSLRMLDEGAETPAEFNLRDYFGNAWSVFRGAKSYDVELSFAADAATIVMETQWHHTQKSSRQRDGILTLSFRVDGLEEICNWILGWTGRVRVVKPAELRELVLTKLQTGLELNRGRH